MVEVFAKIRLIFYTCPTCISQVQITSRKSLVNIEYAFWKGYFCGKNVFLKRRGTLWTTKTSNCTPTTKFRRKTTIRDWKSKRVPREVSSPCGYLCSLELIGSQMEHRTRRKGALTARQQLLIFLYFLGTNSFYHVMHSCHEVSTSTVWQIICRVVPAIVTLKRDFIRWSEHPIMVAAAKFRDIAAMGLSLCGRMCWRNPRSCQPTKSRRRRIR